MSSFWKENDTILTVIFKKIKRNFLNVLNPDTYTKKNIIHFK